LTLPIILRPATPADAEALSTLARAAFIAKFGPLYSTENLTMFLEQALSTEAFAADLADPVREIHLAERGGSLVGFAKIAFACGFPDHVRGSRAMELKQLYTAPDATGGGIGAQLMDWAMARLAERGADEVQLSVYAHNEGGHRFYRRYGFEKVADITFRVGDHIDPEFLFARLL
jgi:ribosomal protein S18 acetylase RimI-like enzyme